MGGGGGVGQRHTPAALSSEREKKNIVREAGWASETVWTGAENLDPTSV